MKNSIRTSLDVELRMSRSYGSSSKGWRLEVIDRTSSLHLLELLLDDAQLGSLLGTSGADVTATYWASPNFGKRLEVKVIHVPLTSAAWDGPERHRTTPTWSAMAAQGYGAQDGWVPQIPEKFNRHNAGPEGYAITLRRYVEVDEDAS